MQDNVLLVFVNVDLVALKHIKTWFLTRQNAKLKKKGSFLTRISNYLIVLNQSYQPGSVPEKQNRGGFDKTHQGLSLLLTMTDCVMPI